MSKLTGKGLEYYRCDVCGKPFAMRNGYNPPTWQGCNPGSEDVAGAVGTVPEAVEACHDCASTIAAFISSRRACYLNEEGT